MGTLKLIGLSGCMWSRQVIRSITWHSTQRATYMWRKLRGFSPNHLILNDIDLAFDNI